MQEIEFDLKGEEYIELFKLLKAVSLVNSGGEAKMFIEEEEVLVNGQTENRKRNKIRAGAKVQFMDYLILVK